MTASAPDVGQMYTHKSSITSADWTEAGPEARKEYERREKIPQKCHEKWR
jgi:hypothetical protein